MPQRVWDDVIPQARRLANATPTLVDPYHGVAVVFDNRMGRNAQPLPAAHMRKETRRDSDWRLSLFRAALALRLAVEQPMLVIDPAAPDCLFCRRPADRARA